MKKPVCIILSLLIIVSSCGLFASASEREQNPLIIVPGFLQPYMYIEGEDGSEDDYLWLPKKEKIFKAKEIAVEISKKSWQNILGKKYSKSVPEFIRME